MKVIRVTKDDIAIVDFIVANLIDNTEERTSTNYLQQLLADDRSYLFAALLDKEVVGYALAYRFPSLYVSDYLAYLYDIEVLATYRRKGAGRLLMKTLLTHLKSDGVSELWLGTATDNVEGQALFTSTGGIK
ncbi:MAG: GNAT family N-acetyltransferase [Gammaproteobacteria bacterium]|nr:GNAT family N-acetyltransferase [Gammaproteobacteria bacterium]